MNERFIKEGILEMIMAQKQIGFTRNGESGINRGSDYTGWYRLLVAGGATYIGKLDSIGKDIVFVLPHVVVEPYFPILRKKKLK